MKLKPSNVVRAFLWLFYAWCTAMFLMGLFSLLLGLAAVFDTDVLGSKPSDGPKFLRHSAFLIVTAVGVFFLGRYAICRFVLGPLEAGNENTDGRQLDRRVLDVDQMATKRTEDMNKSYKEDAAKRRKHDSIDR